MSTTSTGMPADRCRAIYETLVAEVAAPCCQANAFAREFSRTAPPGEWHLPGVLGDHGKFLYPSCIVVCAPEDETPAMLAVLSRTNTAIERLP